MRTPYASFLGIVVHNHPDSGFGVFRATLNGLQRNDYARYIDASWQSSYQPPL
jgi:hypothetical protein